MKEYLLCAQLFEKTLEVSWRFLVRCIDHMIPPPDLPKSSSLVDTIEKNGELIRPLFRLISSLQLETKLLAFTMVRRKFFRQRRKNCCSPDARFDHTSAYDFSTYARFYTFLVGSIQKKQTERLHQVIGNDNQRRRPQTKVHVLN